jgi:PAS domain S-box-containing protein
MVQSRTSTAAPFRTKTGLQSDRVFRLLVDAVQDYAIFMLDPKGHISTWNPGAQRLKGYLPDEIIGKHFSIFYGEEDLKTRKPDYELRAAARVGRFEDEGWRIRKDGSRFWANVVITAVHDESGELIGFGKITRDLTERKYGEERYRLLVEGVADYAIYSLNPEGQITSWNTGAERIKGYSTDEIIGQHFSRFYTPEDVAAGLPKKVLQTALEQGHYEGEGWRVRKDGSRFWSTVVVTPLRSEEGELRGFSKITRDITDRQQLLEEIKKHAEELELTNTELEAFSYSISHDLRAPLRSIEGFAVALREDYGKQLDATAHDYLKEISDAAVRMNRLVQDLLDYSRLSREEMHLEPVSVAQAVSGALKGVGKGADVALSIPAKARVMAHANTLSQVLFNLISNAIKFHRPEVAPEVEVAAQIQKNGFMRISVSDKGIGIAEQHYPRIFEVFERLHGPEEFPGTGIGLAIVKRGVQRMAGRYGVNSKLGAGSTFWIELAVAPGRE